LDSTKDFALDKHLDDSKELIKKMIRDIHAIPSKVQNTINILYKSYDLKPFIHKQTIINSLDELTNVQSDNPKKKKRLDRFIERWTPTKLEKELTWFLVIHLPEAISYQSFKNHEQTFADSIGGSCYIEHQGFAVWMTISNIQLKKKYPYTFNPSDHKMWLPLPVGYSFMGLVVKDLAKMLNLLLIGVPGSGKSNVFHAWIYTLLLMNKGRPLNPKVIVAVIDLKIGEFKYFKNYGILYARKPDEALELLDQLKQENQRRALVMESSSSRKFTGWLKKKGNNMPFIILFVDELAVLSSHAPEALENIRELSSTGRSQGICIVAATQRPSSTIDKKGKFSDLKAMFEATLAMRVRDGINSQMALKDNRASNLPKIAGRGIFDWDVALEVQTMYFPDPDDSKKDEELFNQLIGELDQVALPYQDIKGEVLDFDDFYTQKGILPRSSNLSQSRTTNMFGYKSNPFTLSQKRRV